MKTAITPVLLAIMSLGCAARRFPCYEQGTPYPERPLVLDIQVSRAEAAVGDAVQIQYTLTNTAEMAIPGCFGDRNLYVFFGAQDDKGVPSIGGSSRTVREHGAPFKEVFRLPPRTTLSWVVEVTVPDLGTGPANVVGYLDSKCAGLWTGSVTSKPAPFRILPRLPAEGRSDTGNSADKSMSTAGV